MMRKICLFTLLLMLNTLCGYAVGDTLVFARRADNTAINATAIDFNRTVYDFSVSKDGKIIAAALREKDDKNDWSDKGSLCLCETNSTAVLLGVPQEYYSYSFYFGKGISKQGYDYYEGNLYNAQTKYGLLRNVRNRLEMIDLKTRETKWKDKLNIILINDSLDLIIGYASATSAKLRALKLSTGERLWEVKVPHTRAWGWNDFTVMDDGRLILVADAMNIINPQNGNLIKYKARTGYPDTGAILLQGLAGLGGALVGSAIDGIIFNGAASVYMPYVYYVPNIGANMITGITSGIVRNSDKYYMSDRDSLRCMDNNGNTKWSVALPSRTMGLTKMLVKDNILYMVNEAYGLRGGFTKKKVGKPFIASFDAGTDNTNNFSFLSTKRDHLESAKLTDKGAFLMFDDGLAYQQFGDTTVNVKEWNVKADGKLIAMPKDTIYTFREYDNNLTPLYATDNRCIVVTDKGKMKVINRNLEITEDYQADNIYRVEFVYEDYALVRLAGEEAEDDDYWIIRKSGEPVAHLTIPVQQVRLSGSTLYILSDTKLVKVDLKTLVDKGDKVS